VEAEMAADPIYDEAMDPTLNEIPEEDVFAEAMLD